MIKIFGRENKSSGLLIKANMFSESFVASENMLLHLLRGKLEIGLSKEKITLYPKQLMFVNNNEQLSINSLDEETYLLIYVISDQLLNSTIDMTSYVFSTGVIDRTHNSFDSVQRASNSLVQYLRQNEEDTNFHLLSLSIELLHQITESHLVERRTKKMTDSRISEVLLYIEANYNDTISLDDIASHFQISSTYFSRYFKQKMGLNFLDYLTNFRLEKVAKKMRYSDDKISEIAAQEGFININSFNKKFKLKYECTPKQYREKFYLNNSLKIDTVYSEKLAYLPKNLLDKKEHQEFTIDTNDELIVNHSPWKKIINIGSAEDLLQSDLRKHVKILKKDLGIKYIRFWNLFTKGMNIDPTISTDYNFERIDSIIDFLLTEGLKPFIEVRYKIRRIHRSTREALVFENEDFKFSLNSDEWFDLIRKFMKHINERYGKKVVNDWMMEFSFEHYESLEDLTELVNHYKGTYEIIKSFNPLLKIGGPGTMGKNTEAYDYRKDLVYFYQQKVNFDFISYTLYPYIVGTKGERHSIRIENENFLKETITEITNTVATSGYQGTEIIITEWNNTISNRNAINDSLFKGSYLIKNFSDICDKVDGIAYWVGSDLFSEFIDSKNVLHGGAGLIAKGSIFKPVFHAFRFMNFLKEKIIMKQEGLIVSQNENKEKFSLILFNYQAPSTQYYLMSEDKIQINEINHFFENQEAKLFSLNFAMEPAKKYEIQTFRVSNESGNIIAGWKDIGFRSSLRTKDIEYLQLKAAPDVKFRQVKSDIKGNLKIIYSLEANEFIYITLSSIED